MRFFDNATKKLAELQSQTGDFVTVQKLRAQLKKIDTERTLLFTAIGEVCYGIRMNNTSADGLETMFDDVTRLNEEKARINAEIDRLNHVLRCTGCGAAVGSDLKFCPHCGAPLPKPAPVEEEPVEDEPAAEEAFVEEAAAEEEINVVEEAACEEDTAAEDEVSEA